MNTQAASNELSADDFALAIEGAAEPLQRISMGLIDVYVPKGKAGTARQILISGEGRYMELTLH